MMKTATLLPAPAMLAVFILVTWIGKSSPSEELRQIGVLLLVALPVLALVELVACGYDLLTTKEKLLSVAFAPRLVMHAIGCCTALWILALALAFISMGPINPG